MRHLLISAVCLVAATSFAQAASKISTITLDQGMEAEVI
jgi:hypothetical protein